MCICGKALGPIWGFLYGWTLFLVIQTGTIAAVGVAFGKFLGVFFPAVSQSRWILHVGSGNIGLNTANLAAIAVDHAADVHEHARGEARGSGAECVHEREGAGAARRHRCGTGSAECDGIGGELRACVLRECELAHAAPDEIGSFFGLGGGSAMVGAFTLIAVVQVGSLFSSDAWNNVTFTAGEIQNPKRNLPLSLALGTGVVLLLYILCNFVYPRRAADDGCGRRAHARGPGNRVRRGGSSGDGGDGVGVCWPRGEADGRGNPGIDLRLRKRHAAGGGAGVLRDEPGRAVLRGDRQAGREARACRRTRFGCSGRGPVCFA